MNQYSTPPGWYPDGDGWERRWDGTAWTDDRRRTAARPSDAPSSDAPPAAGSSGGAEATRARPGAEPGSPGPGGWAPPAAPTGRAPGWSGPDSGGAPGGYGQVPPAPPSYHWSGPSGGQPGQGYAGQPGQGYAGQSGYGPPGYGGQGYGGQGGYPQQYGAPPKRRRLGLWIALAVVLVLVVGAGVTLAVVQPWSGDEGTTTTTTADPETISGDLDGDGLGDVVLGLGTSESVRLVEGHSTGEAFETTELAGDPYAVPVTVAVDTDGDGTEERVVAAYDEAAGTLTLRSADEGLAEAEPVRIKFSMLAEYGVLETRVVPGDYDGDGQRDLVVYGQSDREVDVHVMRGDGEGGFAAPELWASIPNTLMNATVLQAGDFDGDGDDDLFAQLPGEKVDNGDYDSNYFIGDSAYTQLTSSGEAFEIGQSTVDENYGTDYLVADLGGEADRVIGLESSPYDEELTLTGYEVVDGRMIADPGWNLVESVGERRLLAATASDVDGDGDEDVVYVVQASNGVKVSDLTVVTTGDEGFANGAAWGPAADCPEEYCSARFY